MVSYCSVAMGFKDQLWFLVPHKQSFPAKKAYVVLALLSYYINFYNKMQLEDLT